jgi:GNAT superfamily N-acetyltransferase
MPEVEPIADVPAGYRAWLYGPPVEAAVAEALLELVGHKGEPWLADIEARLAGEGLDLFAATWKDEEPVAHAWLGSSAQCPRVGLVGHVFTAEEHRRRGLASRLLGALLARFDDWGGRWAQLSTGSEAAARLYRRFGFAVVAAGQPGEDGERHRVMRRGPEVAEAYFEHSGAWRVERLSRDHYAGLCLLLNAEAGSSKLPLLGIGSGLEAERLLLEALQAQQREECHCRVLLDAESGRPQGLACVRGGEAAVYAPRAPGEAKDELQRHAAGADAPAEGEQ